MWQEINSYAQDALDSNMHTVDLLKASRNACNGDGEAALAKIFVSDLHDQAHALDGRIRRFMLAINKATLAEAERSKP